MKYVKLFIPLLICLSGCGDAPISDKGSSALDVWMVGATNDAAICNSIIRQSTLFPYQFEQNSAELNSLGTRDLVVLATHFQSYPGKLNVRRGYEDDDLYQQRVNKVAEYLARAGVPKDKIIIENQPQGGDGMPSELVVLILKADAAGYQKGSKGYKRKESRTTMSGGSR